MKTPHNTFKQAMAEGRTQVGLWAALANAYSTELLAGSFTRPVAARVGDVFEADYGPLGRMTFKFV